jgi:diguanylate cyclase (GGDEF)-like protein
LQVRKGQPGSVHVRAINPTARFAKLATAFIAGPLRRYDAALIFGLAAIAVVWLKHVEAAERLLAFAGVHERLALADLWLITSLFGAALIAVAYRRNLRLQGENLLHQAAEQDSWNLARHDTLTGLPNRRYFTEMVAEAIGLVNEHDTRAAVLMFKLTGFKAVNEIYGRHTGDQALLEIAQGISAILDPGTIFARVGGDEFAILQTNIATRDDPLRLANIIVEAIGRASVAGDTAGTLGACIGITIAPEDGSQVDAILRRAGIASRLAKESGPGSIRFFEPAMNERAETRAWIERGLRAALPKNAVTPYYQPQVTLKDNKIVGFEMLARWTSPDFGTVSPDVFISIAEETGLIKELGDRLLRQACSDAREWPSHLVLAVNVSPRQLHDKTLGLRILGILAETGFSPHRLEIEITESALVGDIDIARKVIEDLRTAGVRIALDDFGTGYATLSQLVALRFDKIKIDQSFVGRLGKDSDSTVIVRAIVGLVQGLGLIATAEGIEESAQCDALRSYGCDQGQGYLFSKAIPAHDVPRLLTMPMPAIAA